MHTEKKQTENSLYAWRWDPLNETLFKFSVRSLLCKHLREKVYCASLQLKQH